MNVALIVAVVLAVAALFGAWRTLGDAKSHRVLRIALQLAAAMLIYLALFPPQVDQKFSAGTLVVLTPGATPAQLAHPGDGIATVALPGVAASRDIERAPDLGTALRRHPDASRVRVVGGGLPARDVDAARDLAVEFDAAPLPDGIVDLSIPESVRAGSVFAVRGRVQGDARGRIELRDPAGAVVARADLAEDGTFALDAQAKSAGDFMFGLRVLDAKGATREDVAEAVAVQPGDKLSVLVLAGAPDPELKYLRRWAVDAGVDLTSRIVLSDGIAMQDGAAMLGADALAKTDLVMIDERAWKNLDAGTKQALENAARDGLGLFLRVTGPLPDAVANEWRDLGFRVRGADIPETVSLEASAPDPAAVLSRRALLVDGDDAAPLVRGNDGGAVAMWRTFGQGRVAIWWLADTYRMTLAGDAGAFGSVWSRALATVARARGVAKPDVPRDARVDQRSVLCGLADGAFVEEPDGARAQLAIEANGCAAFWPAHEGWHTLVSRDARTSFHAAAANASRALAAARDAEATRMLAGRARVGDATSSSRGMPASRWPFFGAWLAAAALLWWLERSRPRAPDA
ncbi:MAG TPA: hypothetical protein VFL30_05830 [Rhodanobacteraceae bacterium]|nr:hypothetical protein [Rhodanobacteraceae bacterium]